MSWHAEIDAAWLAALRAAAPRMLVLAAAGGAAAWLGRRLPDGSRRRAPVLASLGAAGLGLVLVIGRAAVYDDAFISFRYADNWAAGLGPVFNAGERVEGYTNFLWTALLALLSKLTPWQPPELSLVLCPAIYLACLAVTFRLSRVLSGAGALPFAVVLLAVQGSFVDYGTSGLETELACLFVCLGLLSLLRASTPEQVARAGLWLVLATLTRPDHALFYAVGSAVVLAAFGPPAWRARGGGLVAAWRDGGAQLAGWAAPFALVVAHTLWRLAYYGQWLPNTYYAKSAGDSNFTQGLVYAHSFLLGSHLWLLLAAFVLGVALPAGSTERRRFRAFAIGAVVLYGSYVLKVGGDFMYGRFFVSLLPLVLLGAELAITDLMRSEHRRTWAAGVAVAAVLASTAGGLRLLPVRKTRWHLSDESSVYPVTHWFPVAIDHSNYRVGKALSALQAAGVRPLVATSGVGMLGYYSRLPILDRVGLVDAVVAHQPLAHRGRPGHEKIAAGAYIEERDPTFMRGGDVPKRYRELTAIRFLPRGGGRGWHIHRYDRPVMAAVREHIPGARFQDFERHLDRYIARLGTAARPPRHELERDLSFFRRYYFDHEDDPGRLAALEQALGAAAQPPSEPR